MIIATVILSAALSLGGGENQVSAPLSECFSEKTHLYYHSKNKLGEGSREDCAIMTGIALAYYVEKQDREMAAKTADGLLRYYLSGLSDDAMKSRIRGAFAAVADRMIRNVTETNNWNALTAKFVSTEKLLGPDLYMAYLDLLRDCYLGVNGQPSLSVSVPARMLSVSYANVLLKP